MLIGPYNAGYRVKQRLTSTRPACTQVLARQVCKTRPDDHDQDAWYESVVGRRRALTLCMSHTCSRRAFRSPSCLCVHDAQFMTGADMFLYRASPLSNGASAQSRDHGIQPHLPPPLLLQHSCVHRIWSEPHSSHQSHPPQQTRAPLHQPTRITRQPAVMHQQQKHRRSLRTQPPPQHP